MNDIKSLNLGKNFDWSLGSSYKNKFLFEFEVSSEMPLSNNLLDFDTIFEFEYSKN